MKITCPICERKILSHSYFIYCNCCHRNVYRNCTELTCDWLIVAKTGTFWYCRVCNENIFPFNNIDDDYEFNLAIMEYGNKSFYTNHQSYFSEEKLFDPYEINENENIIEYQGELDPDKHYFNQLAHHLSRSSNYYSDENLNKLIRQKNMNSESFSVLHLNIRTQESPRQLDEFYDLHELCWSLLFSDWFFWNMADPFLIWHLWYQWIQTCWIDQGHGEGRWCVPVYRRKIFICWTPWT